MERNPIDGEEETNPASATQRYGIDDEKKRKKQKRRRTSRTIYLPVEILLEILVRNDVKCLARLKCVSKSWYALINEPFFTRTHFHRSLRNPNPHIGVILYNKDQFFSMDLKQSTLRKIECPFKSDDMCVRVFGSCGGVFLISVAPRRKRGHMFFSKLLYLWNPTTADYVKVPESFSDTRPGCQRAVYGIGYDSSKHDFKVIRILYYYDDSDPFLREWDVVDYRTDVRVYSLHTHSHRRIPDVPYFILGTFQHPDFYVSGVSINTALHWLGNTDPRVTDFSLRIVSFSVADEEYGEIHLPNYWENRSREDAGRLEIGAFNERLCLYVAFDDQGLVRVITMTEYGVTDSWQTMLSIKNPVFADAYLYFRAISMMKGKLLGQWKCKHPFWYKLQQGRQESQEYRIGARKKLKMDGVSEAFKQQFYMETYLSSLVSLEEIQGS